MRTQNDSYGRAKSVSRLIQIASKRFALHISSSSHSLSTQPIAFDRLPPRRNLFSTRSPQDHLLHPSSRTHDDRRTRTTLSPCDPDRLRADAQIDSSLATPALSAFCADQRCRPDRTALGLHPRIAPDSRTDRPLARLLQDCHRLQRSSPCPLRSLPQTTIAQPCLSPCPPAGRRDLSPQL